MSAPSFDRAAAERAAAGLELVLPRARLRGRTGEARAASVGASLEIHDFRAYQPGDDVRHVDWNAVARTGDLVIRVRQAEVAPRLEVLLDASRSMALTPAKAARAKELALLAASAALARRLEVRLLAPAARPTVASGGEVAAALERLELDAVEDLGAALARGPAPRPCGVRVVVSDFLFDTDLRRLAAGLRQGAAALALLQILDPADAEVPSLESARLVDVESGEGLDRVLLPSVVAAFARRFEQHQRLLEESARRAGALFLTASAEASIGALARGPLSPLLRPRGWR